MQAPADMPPPVPNDLGGLSLIIQAPREIRDETSELRQAMADLTTAVNQGGGARGIGL
jgi:hypothetical protein